MIHIFDMDGPLTKSRRKMPKGERARLVTFLQANQSVLVTGSTRKQIEDQLGDVADHFWKVFSCSGNEDESTDILNSSAQKALKGEWRRSTFYRKSKNYIEDRPGTANFSIIGHCSESTPQWMALRHEYAGHDKRTGERLTMVRRLASKCPEYEFCIGGSVSVDVYPKGRTKAQILDWMPSTKFNFYCNTPEKWGGDHSLAEAVLARGGNVYKCEAFDHTARILMKQIGDKPCMF